MNCLDKIKEALLTVTENVGHYEALKQDDNYIVWAEDGGGQQINGDNTVLEQAITGAIHLYTRDGDCVLFMAVDKALTDAKISHRLSMATYEDDTKYIHYTWDFEVSGT